ncbi:MAG TPA: HEPN domain-containing protein [Polyangiaceae bacterium]|nr:HEPN domain-containing protein [Polyangiaceae bacterium]
MTLSARIPLEVVRLVRTFEERLRERFGAELCDVRLFGSYARGAGHEGSDVDVLVLLERLDYARQRDVLNIAGDLLVDSDLLLSPTVFDRARYRAHLDQGRPLAAEIEHRDRAPRPAHMTSEGCALVVEEELRLAREELLAAERLIGIDLYRIALTRSYFAVFHAARATLYAQGFDPKTHQGVLTLFNQQLVRPGHFEPRAARVLARLQKFREQADYGEVFVVDRQGAEEELVAARAFVDTAVEFSSRPSSP